MYNPRPMNKRYTVTVLIGAALLGLATGIGVYSSKFYPVDTRETQAIRGLLWPNPKVLSSFTAIDQDGKEFGLERMLGKWSFVFFGYTHCPDVCPITLSVLNQVHAQLAKTGKSQNVQIIFVTVDPKRDTTNQLKSYVNYFNPEFIGIGGSEQQINDLGRQIGITSIQGEESIPGEYLVDHTASIFLFDPKGRLVSLFSAPQQVDNTVEQFLEIRKFIEGQG